MTLTEWLASKPELAQLSGILSPAMPVLSRLAIEQAVAALESLFSPDNEYWLEVVRENATDAEWQAIAANVSEAGNAAALKQWQDADELRKMVLALALGGLGLLAGMV